MNRWKNGLSQKPEVGMKVRKGRSVRRIKAIYRDIAGGVRLDREVDGFVSWNVGDLVPLGKESK